MLVPSFTPDQYQYIMKILDNDNASQQMNMVSMAGMTQTFVTSLSSKSSSTCLDTPSWVVDSGATNHIVYSLGSLLNFTSIRSHFDEVYLPNGQTTKVQHISTVKNFDNCTLSNVLHMPLFEYNLLSVSKLTKKLQCCVSFYPHFCLFQDLCTGRVKGIGKEKEGLYILPSTMKLSPVKDTTPSSFCSTSTQIL